MAGTRGGKKAALATAVAKAGKSKAKASLKQTSVITFRDKKKDKKDKVKEEKNEKKKRGKRKDGITSESIFGSIRKALAKRGPTDLPLSHPGHSNTGSAGKKGRNGNGNSNLRSLRNRPKTPPRTNSSRTFVVRLPNRVSARTPWLKSTIRKQSSCSVRAETTTCPLLKCLTATSLARLDDELQQFANYVRLNQTELQSRHFLVQRLEKLARDLFESQHKQGCGTHIRFGEEKTPSPPNDIFVKVFGSFATPSVCMFQSDVDLALWGVVDPPTKEMEGTANEPTPSPPPVVAKPKPPPNSSNKSKKDNRKLNKWKAAILEAENAISSANLATQDEGGDDDDSNGGVQELFVIDRAGLEVDLADEIKKEELDEPEPKASKRKLNEDIVDGNPIGRKPMLATMMCRQTKLKDDGKKVIELEDLTQDVLPEKSPNEEGVDDTGTVTDVSANESSPGTLQIKGKAIACRVDRPGTHVDADSDADTADKLDALRPRAYSLPDAEEAHFMAKRDSTSACEAWEQFGQDIISVSSSASDNNNNEELLDESRLEVAFFSDPLSSKPSYGPSGKTRELVLRALKSLSKQLRKPKFALAKQLQVRKHARVPIINMTSPFGYECDIAMGGHNGTDTSAYASTQAAKYDSFATVVLVLKVLLTQNDLDKPFTGGLGSFKLYVLVAHHLERYLSRGGIDRPAEVLLSFLFRYGKVPGYGHVPPNFCTVLSQLMVLSSKDGGSADFGAVHQLDNCVRVFGIWFDRLWEVLEDYKGESSFSMLAHVVDTDDLDRQRRNSQRQAANVKQYIQKSDSESDNNVSQKQNCSSNSPKKPLRTEEECLDTDEEAAQLKAGYNVAPSSSRGRSPSANSKRGSTKKRSKSAKKARKEKSLDGGNKRGIPAVDAPLGAKRRRTK